MTTTISPFVGHGPWTQQGTGSSPGYDAVDVRRLMSDVGEGVTTYGSFRVTQRGVGSNMSVDCNMDDFAYVRGDAVSLQGVYKVPPHTTTINETIAAADATNPRIDRVILEVKDSQHDASGSSLAQTRVITGTPDTLATLDSLLGAAAVPSSAILLADVLVPAASSSVTNANIRDRRPFVTGIPPLLTDVDMAPLIPVAGLPQVMSQVGLNALNAGMSANEQGAVLCYLPRRIVSATRLRWKYVQDTGTALTGNYALTLYDASARQIIGTGSVAFTGATSSVQARAETITATTFEAGYYYVHFGSASTNATTANFMGAQAVNLASGPQASPPFPNAGLYSATGGVTAPSTLLGFTDLGGTTAQGISVPLCALSVG